MPGLEWQAVTPEESIRELDDAVKQRRETKYAFQVGLRDLEFEVDEDKGRSLGLTLPLQSLDEAEQALRERVVRPNTFLENDGTQHQVIVFDPQPVGCGGFMNCVTHSLALTDQGLFEVGRYAAMNLASRDRHWQWFVHRRLATPEQISALREHSGLSDQQIVNVFLEHLIGQRR